MTVSELMQRGKEGGPPELKFTLGLDETSIQAIEQKYGAKLPLDYRETLSHCAEIEGLDAEIEFTGASFETYEETFMPNGLAFAHDGCGNYWCVDLVSEQEEKAAVFFLCHDPAEFRYECQGISEFLDACLKATLDPHAVFGFDASRPNTKPLTHAEAISSDPVLRDFAKSLGPDVLFLDLRTPIPGASIDMLQFDRATKLYRHPTLRIFAYGPLKKPGLLGRLFGGKK